MQKEGKDLIGDSITFIVKKGKKNQVIKTGRPLENSLFVEEIKCKINKMCSSKHLQL